MAASGFDAYRVRPGSRVSLDKRDPADRAAFDGDKDDGLKRVETLNARLGDLQEVLYAEHHHRILIVLQAMDAGGKDGTIRSVFTGVNPQGVDVVSFKQPTPDERDHDFLWRVHPKFFLHISKDEQRARLQERADNPKKRWKFSHGDIEQRKYWNSYMRAYEDALAKTSTDYAPWYVVPANRNWYRNLVVSEVLVDALRQLKMKFPSPAGDLSNLRIR